jgi:hypothetical protein
MATSKKTPQSKKAPKQQARATGKRAKPAPQARGAAAMKAKPRATTAPQRAKAAPATKKKADRVASAPAALNQPGKPGRPSSHTPEVAAALCELLMGGKTLREACAVDGMPSVSSVMRWLHDDVAGFRQQYARAREVQAELDVDDQVAIADHPQRYATVSVRKDGQGTLIPVLVALDPAEVANRRLACDARRWRASKMAPKKYGSLLDNANGGSLPIVLVNDLTGRKPQGAPPAGIEQPQAGEQQEGAAP